MGSPDSFRSSAPTASISRPEEGADRPRRPEPKEDALRSIQQGNEELRILRRLEAIDRNIHDIEYILAHPEEADRPGTYYRSYDDRSQVYRYSSNNPSRVVLDRSDTSRIPSVEVVHEKDLRTTLKDLRKEQDASIRTVPTLSERAQAETRSENEKHDREKSSLSRTINEAKQNGGDRIYEMDRKYFTSDPSRVVLDPLHHGGDSLRVHEITIADAEKRLDRLDAPRTREEMLTLLDATIDRLAGSPDEKHPYREKVRTYLMSIRLGVSGLSSPSWTLVSLPSADSIRRIARIGDMNTESIEMPELVEGLADMANIARYGASDALTVMISLARIMTDRIYMLGEGSPTNEAMKKALHEYLPDFVAWPIGSLEMWGAATLSWALNGGFDYVQATLDTVVVPDKIAQNMSDLSKALWRDFPWFCEGLYELFKKNIQNDPASIAYVVSYIMAIVACYVYTPNPASLVSLPSLLVDVLDPITRKFHIPPGVAEEVVIMAEGSIGGKLKRGLETPKEAFDKGDTANTATQRLSNEAESIRAQETATLLRTITSADILTNIFGQNIANIHGETPKDMTSAAMDIYVRTILTPKGYDNIRSLDDAIAHTPTNASYNLLRVREEYEKIRETMEKEVMPVAFQMMQIKKADASEDLLYEQRIKERLPVMSELGRKIITLFYLR